MRWILFILVPLFSVDFTMAGEISIGSISGRLIDMQTKEPLPGANIVIVGTDLGAATDQDGNYIIEKLAAGAWSIQLSYMGYSSVILTDIIVRPGRTTRLDYELRPAILESGSITVSADYFPDHAEKPVSITGFSREEIRRAPGSAGDISRIIMGLPSLAKVNDQSNSLIVRGGSPVENAFFIDDIEIPNINHFPTQGSSGGPIGIINVDFIDNVEFQSGGFDAQYGDRLSSVMNIRFREGDHEKIQGQVTLDFAGFGGLLEGPFSSEKGSWIISARRSYLDMLVKMVDTGTSLAPGYGDIQTKLVFNLTPSQRISIIGLLADSHSESTRDIALENAMLYYGRQDSYQGATGLNWQWIWGKNGYSRTVVSYNQMKFDEQGFDTGSGSLLTENRSVEHKVNLTNHNFYKLDNYNSLEFGFQINRLFLDYDNYFAASTDPLGNPIPALRIDLREAATKYGLFISYIFRPFSFLTANLGLRTDHFSVSERYHLSPRFSLSWQVSDRSTISAAAGMYFQNLPLNLMAQKKDYRKLAAMQANHLILGFRHMITENTIFSLETYYKQYEQFPLDPDQPGLFVIDELYYNYGFFTQHGALTDLGRAYTRGVEALIQKKLARDFYGMISASWFRSAYMSGDRIWRDRVYDNRIVFNIEGGYKPNHLWEFSLRWIFAGGVPYTPFDLNASREQNSGILDKERINSERLPDYHSLNLRLDRRFNFSTSNIVLYLSIWNVYNRKNIATYYWDSRENRQGVIYQWGILPVFGIEFEF